MVALLYFDTFKSVIFERVKVKSQKCWDDPKFISNEDLKITVLEKKVPKLHYALKGLYFWCASLGVTSLLVN